PRRPPMGNRRVANAQAVPASAATEERGAGYGAALADGRRVRGPLVNDRTQCARLRCLGHVELYTWAQSQPVGENGDSMCARKNRRDRDGAAGEQSVSRRAA